MKKSKAIQFTVRLPPELMIRLRQAQKEYPIFVSINYIITMAAYRWLHDYCEDDDDR